MTKTILVTGGTGYIGSHTVITLIEHNYNVVILDNLSNSSSIVLERIKKITGRSVDFLLGDVRNSNLLKEIFNRYNIFAVIHFAGLKSVSESISNPLAYYQNNLSGTLSLLEQMQRANVNNLIFSSSATVYGNPERIPLDESCHVGGTTNPYGTSKYFSELILKDASAANEELKVVILRYFNPAGAHPSGALGECPDGTPNNLIPYLLKVANGSLEYLSVYGSDYPTKDGTGVRDYIHVMDLANGHLAALNSLIEKKEYARYRVYNLGTGHAYSVLDVIKSFEKQNKINIKYKFSSRRHGDVAECWSDPSLAEKELSWHADLSLDDMMVDGWRWQTLNPKGFDSNGE
ncbi:UDP-glucose 4-epimerase GalE [Salmonella enterica subsp. salamae serovar 56:b:[1,5]]|uniref:UDP-glucose 4-epimerase n=1 Tax=Salmonella enterica subsp. salamae serovar 56:b:[1,5] TaxID=2577858 RepID=A0A6C7CT45_SALER|nr:UDP-glucose 4-epimerase GalE [Salmonella enterica]AXC85538.1 UDP-glucose 4-epimerase GalE [Salmonella enterica subsp. salamae serovar 56:b:[1,5]]